MSEENTTDVEKKLKETNYSKNITIKKSTYNGLKIAVIVAIATATFFAGFLVASSNQSTSSDPVLSSDWDDLKARLEAQLVEMEQRSVLTQQSAQSNIPSIIQVSFDDDPVKGNPDAPITVVEFSDFQCPFCFRFFDQTLPLLEKDYIDTGKVKLVYRDLPIDSIHPNARPTHIAAECADEQGMFWQYHDILFENQVEWNILGSADLDSQLKQYATTIGLQSASFDQCLLSQDIADEVNADVLEAVSYGAAGTPTFFIGNEENGFVKVVGAQPYQVFQTIIDSQLG